MIDEIKNKLAAGGWYRIAFLGDSITSAEWVFPNWRAIVEYVLRTELETAMGDWDAPWWYLRFYHEGYIGASTRELIGFVADEVARIRPDMVIFMDTYNDRHFDLGEEEHESNLVTIFGALEKYAGKIVYSSSTPRLQARLNEENEKYRHAAERAVSRYDGRITNVDLCSEISKLDPGLIYTFTYTAEDAAASDEKDVKIGEIDGVHPNVFGNAHIARIMLKEIFGVDFDPERFLAGVAGGKKYPEY